jgi:hypothetical protein
MPVPRPGRLSSGFPSFYPREGGIDLEYPLYINPRADTVYFDTVNALRYSVFDIVEDVHIRRIAIAIKSTRGNAAFNAAFDAWALVTSYSRLEKCVLVAPAHSTFDGGRYIMGEIKRLEEKVGGPGLHLIDSAVLTFMTQSEFEGVEQVWGGDSKFAVRVAV